MKTEVIHTGTFRTDTSLLNEINAIAKAAMETGMTLGAIEVTHERPYDSATRTYVNRWNLKLTAHKVT